MRRESYLIVLFKTIRWDSQEGAAANDGPISLLEVHDAAHDMATLEALTGANTPLEA